MSQWTRIRRDYMATDGEGSRSIFRIGCSGQQLDELMERFGGLRDTKTLPGNLPELSADIAHGVFYNSDWQLFFRYLLSLGITVALEARGEDPSPYRFFDPGEPDEETKRARELSEDRSSIHLQFTDSPTRFDAVWPRPTPITPPTPITAG